MKTRFLLLLILLAIVALVIVNLLPEQASTTVEPNPSKESFQTLLLDEVELKGDQTVEGKLIPAITKQVKFEVDGTLEKGDIPFKVGQTFKFNQLLIKVNMKEIFGKVSDLKISMEQTLDELMPKLESSFPGEVNKWKEFTKELHPVRRLPAFPLLNSKEEGDLLRSTTFLKEYVKAAKLEEEVEKYFYLAPFDGKIERITKRPGSNMTAGETIAVISKKGLNTVMFDASMDVELKKMGTLEYVDADGNSIGTGKYLRTNASSVVYSFSPKGAQIGTEKVFIKISNGVKCFRIPKGSVKENKVRILSGETVNERQINVLKVSGDSLYVSGLKAGEVLILP